jgi:hypothetical protein
LKTEWISICHINRTGSSCNRENIDERRSSSRKASRPNLKTRKYYGPSGRLSSRPWSSKITSHQTSLIPNSSHRSKNSALIKNSQNEDAKKQTESHVSQKRKKPKSCKMSAVRDTSKCKKEMRRKVVAKDLILSSYLKPILFKHVTVGKFWKRQKLWNRILIGPRIGFNPVGISGKLIENIKETLYKWDTDSIPNFYQLDGILKSGCLLYHDYSTTENDDFKTNLMITNPNSEETTGLLQNSLLDLKEGVTYIPELRMESMKSPERNREYYSTKINMFWVYPNWSFEIYPIKSISLVGNPLSRSLMQIPSGENSIKLNYGFLSLDTKGRIVTFEKDDPNRQKSYMVGIWISGLNISEKEFSDPHLKKTDKEELKNSSWLHNYVWKSLIEFLLDTKFTERRSASKNKNVFLLMNFLRIGKSIHPQLWEFKLCSAEGDNDNKWVVSKFKNASNSTISSDTNLMFKPTQSETYSFKEFYNLWLPSKRQNNFENTRKRSSNRNSKTKKEDKSLWRSKPTILSKIIQEQNDEKHQSGRISNCDSTRNSKGMSTLDDSNKENVNMENVKSLDLAQIKFNRSKVSQKGNWLMNQVWTKNGQKFKVEMHNKVNTDSDSESIDAHILQKLNIKKSNFKDDQVREDSDQMYAHNLKLFKQKVTARNNKTEKSGSIWNEYKQDSTIDKTGEEWKAQTTQLKRENSQKVFLKNDSLSTNQHENLNQEFLTITDSNGSLTRTIVYNPISECHSTTNKIDKVSTAGTPHARSKNWLSPDFITEKKSELSNSNSKWFETSSNLNASPGTKKIIMEQAQNIQSLQSQIFELQKHFTRVNGPNSLWSKYSLVLILSSLETSIWPKCRNIIM